jgi:hypothetical protein
MKKAPSAKISAPQNSSPKQTSSAKPLSSSPKTEKKTAKKTNWTLRFLIILLFFMGGGAATIYFLPQIESRAPIVTGWLQNNAAPAEKASSAAITTLDQKLSEQQTVINTLQEKISSQNLKLSALSEVVSDNSQKIQNPVTITSDNNAAATKPPALTVNTAEMKRELAASIAPQIERLESKITLTAKNLSQRLDALKIRLSEEEKNSESSHAQTARIDMVFSRISSLEAAFVPLSRDLREAQNAKKERRDITEINSYQAALLSAMSERMTALEAFAARDTSGSLLQMHLYAVTEKITLGAPYNNELAAFKELAAKGAYLKNSLFQNALAWLELQREDGILSSYDLRSDFNALIPAIINAKKATEETGFFEGIGDGLTSLFSLRRTDGTQGRGRDGLIRQTELALKDHKIRRALAATEKMPAEVQTILAAWKLEAQKTITAEETLKNLKKITNELLFSPKEETPVNETALSDNTDAGDAK